jgi:hypothetical protein
MLAPQLILAAGIFVGCGAAGASPLIPVRSDALLRSDTGIETVRWRHRHRSFWSGDSTVGRGDSDSSIAGADGSIRRPRARALGDEHGTSVRVGLSA